MKNLRIPFLLAVLMFLLNVPAHADDFYYDGGVHYNPYNGYTVMSLPPPPPMNTVPFYVRDDYDDYVEDYYECILGYEYKGMTCRYWRKYAEKNGLYQKTPYNAQQNQNGVNNAGSNMGSAPVNNIQNNNPVNTYQADTSAVQQPVQNGQAVNNNINVNNQPNTIEPYIPTHQ